jgi:hypothetical protein
MSTASYQVDLNKALRIIAQKLDLDETRYKNADEKYQAVGKWLSEEGSLLDQYGPEIYPQGSFLLGTMVKPIEADYDLDGVCHLTKGGSLTSKHSYELVGTRLRQNSKYSAIIEPMTRCWRLNYADEFHLDVIPAITDAKNGDGSVLIPDRELVDWTESNPKGYAAWFQSRMAAQLGAQKIALARKLNKDVEEIPDYLVKAPLQQAVQLMKRHRDIMFSEKPEDKPISIIITTLAGQAYLDKGDLFVTLRNIVAGMPNHIQERNGEPWIANPTNLDENFADKWKKHPERRSAFYEWGEKLQDDLEALARCESLADCEQMLKYLFGETLVTEALKEFARTNPVPVIKSRFNVPHKQDPSLRWKMTMTDGVKVGVRAFIENGSTHVQEFHSDSNPIDKNLSIFFLARTQNVDRPYEVQWQVVNTGDEASGAGGLRGGFYGSEIVGDHKRCETTLYKGMHWVEALVIKNGYCLARSGEFVVNIK